VKMRYIHLLLIIVAIVSSAVSAQESNPATVNLGGSWGDFGLYLVDAEGISLYTFRNDTDGISTCYAECAMLAPPLLVGEEEFPTLEEGISGRLSVTTREDGSRQVTYNGKPLYYFHEDTEPGFVGGHFRDEQWFVAYPPLVGLRGNDELGSFLVDERGLSLYTFANDTAGVSNCAEDCATNWPPLLVPSEDSLRFQEGITGEFGLIERGDRWQVTFNGQPLYFYSGDEAVGDATGHGLGDVWSVARVNTISQIGNNPALLSADGMSLYMFAPDTEGISNCYDECALLWPPLTLAEGEELLLSESLNAAAFSTIEREDGLLQVTYYGKPLYRYAYDVLPADRLGEEVDDAWFLAEIG
jgi:predicted lipoprotein with Yx(FWY)xxD motif